MLSSLNALYRFGGCSGIFPGILSQVRQYAARKGTRERKKKAKVKKEVIKLTFEQRIKKFKKIAITKPEAILQDDSKKPEAEDDLYFANLYKQKIYSFAEAIECHREIFHPTMYDATDSLLQVFVELNMKGVKKTKPVEAFNKIVLYKHLFDHGEQRNILVICKTDDQVKEALEAGANLAGGSDVIKLILDGEISVNNYDAVVAHPIMMPEVLTIRGILKRKHPNMKTGTMGPDIKRMVQSQLHGIKYEAKPYDHFPEYGFTTIMIGRLDMEVKQLEENLKDALESIMKSKPNRPGNFIQRVRLECPPSEERLKINHRLYVDDEEEDIPVIQQKVVSEDAASDDEDEQEAIPLPA